MFFRPAFLTGSLIMSWKLLNIFFYLFYTYEQIAFDKINKSNCKDNGFYLYIIIHVIVNTRGVFDKNFFFNDSND